MARIFVAPLGSCEVGLSEAAMEARGPLQIEPLALDASSSDAQAGAGKTVEELLTESRAS